MKHKTILTLALAVMLAGALAGTPAIAATNGQDTGADYEAPAGVGTSDSPDGSEWCCPRCGAECRGCRGGHGFGHHGMRRGKGHADYGHRGRGDRDHRPGAGLAAERLLRKAATLELTDEQIKQLEQLAYNAKSKLIDLETECSKARLEMRRQMETNSDDVAALKKHLDSLAKKRVSIQVLKLENWIDAKKVLTDEQKTLIRMSYPRLGMRL
jgi:Spy/CpxP family protein refolding chaperone